MSALAPDHELARALDAQAPRTPEQVRTIVGRGGRGFRNIGLIVWAAVLLVAGVIGATTPGKEVATFFEALLFGLIWAGPTTIFVLVNQRKLTACAREGVLHRALVASARQVGKPGNRINDATLEVAHPDGRIGELRASGFAQLPQAGDTFEVLLHPGRPDLAGIVASPLGIIMARVQWRARAG